MYCAGSRPLLPIMSLSADTASVRLNGFQQRDVRLAVKVDPAGSSGCTARRSSRTSKALTGPSPGSPAFAGRVRVIVHPSLFWLVFDATNRTCTEFAVALFSNAT